MKKIRILFGLILALALCCGHAIHAQTKAKPPKLEKPVVDVAGAKKLATLIVENCDSVIHSEYFDFWYGEGTRVFVLNYPVSGITTKVMKNNLDSLLQIGCFKIGLPTGKQIAGFKYMAGNTLKRLREDVGECNRLIQKALEAFPGLEQERQVLRTNLTDSLKNYQKNLLQSVFNLATVASRELASGNGQEKIFLTGDCRYQKTIENDEVFFWKQISELEMTSWSIFFKKTSVKVALESAGMGTICPDWNPDWNNLEFDEKFWKHVFFFGYRGTPKLELELPGMDGDIKILAEHVARLEATKRLLELEEY